MARRSGAARMLRLGLLVAAGVAWGLAACGDSKSPDAIESPGPETGNETGNEPSDAGDTDPPPVSATPDAAGEGPPPIGGLDPGEMLSPQSCMPGATQTCLREQLCMGTASCGADGRFGACVCPSA